MFVPGETTKTATVQVCANAVVEPYETVFVNLRNPSNATLSGAQGQGTILNDDELHWTSSGPSDRMSHVFETS